MSLSVAAAVLAAAAATTASVAAGQLLESRDSPRIADLWSISISMSVFFPVLITLLAFACLRLCRPPDAPGAGATASPPEVSHSGPGGLDAASIAALPLVFYRDVRRHQIKDGDDALECTVCLLEFEDDDALRLLPTCPHAFHPECIGLWLERHATCPLCRASLLDALGPAPQQLETAPLPPDSSPDHPTVVLIGDAGDIEEEEDWSRIQCLARNRRAAGRQALPRSNSTGHDDVGGGGSMERFALRLPEHVRMEILMSHRLRHVTSAVESVRVREGSAHGSTVDGGVRSAVARLLSRFALGDGDDKSSKEDASGASPHRRRENSSRGAVGEEKRSV